MRKIGHRVYILTETQYKRLKTMGKPLKCFKCGKPLKINDKVVSRNSGKRITFKIWHFECFESMLY